MILLLMAFWGFVLGVPALIIAGIVLAVAKTGHTVKQIAQPASQTWQWNPRAGRWERR